ncbi:Axial budding pattern protein 2 [Leucoagaricus sp. SymC.cos]|nr:Axial budding pattern protein 2 [Leucoagaricus sp. SymC.cos]
MIVALFAFSCLAPVIHAASNSVVTVANTLANQLPPVARVGANWSWTCASNTFHAPDGHFGLSTSPLPEWAAFNAEDFTFSGTPSEADVGVHEVIVTATGPSSKASSRFSLFVSKDPPPIPRISIATQFSSENPSMSSVFFPLPGSCLATDKPTVRVPSKWSFSIGFEYKTFEPGSPESENKGIFYDVLQANGSSLPPWMIFNRQEITLNGVTPQEKDQQTPIVLGLQLHASDQEGYTADIMAFNFVVATHELTILSSLPTINVTSTKHFQINLGSPADFAGLFVDGKPIRAQNISTLNIDVSGSEDWLHYSPLNRTLSGKPRSDLAGQKLSLPVEIGTTFNQVINTSVSVAVVPSYFTQGDLPTIYAAPGDGISFNLARFFTGSPFETSGDVDLSMIYEPSDVDPWLHFTGGSLLEGTVPADCPTMHILVTFIAFSHITRSTSHASMPIYVTAPENTKKTHRGHWGGLSGTQHAKLVLALAITFGILGGLCLVGGLLAIVRKVARVEDTALTGEEGRNAWSEKDRKWYGIDGGSPASQTRRWAERLSPRIFGSKTLSPRPGQPGNKVGLGLRRVHERSGERANRPTSLSAQSSGVMSKREFFARLKQTVSEGRAAAIGRPVLVRAKTAPPAAEVLPFEHMVDAYPANLFGAPGNPESTNFTQSPSSSTAGYSIPQRRSDFGRPKPKTQVHFDEGRHLRPISRASTRSNKSLTVFSQDSPLVGVMADVSPVSPTPAVVRPRLVPFTSSTRVPVPSLSPNAGPSTMGLPITDSFFADGKRITSQKAKIMKMPASSQGTKEMKRSGSGDELRMGLHYVQALGADNQIGTVTSPGVSSNVRSSFSSLESSNPGHKPSTGTPTEKRVVVTPGQKFKFTLHVDLNGIETRGTAEVSGESTKEDVGVITFGIYAGRNDEICLATIVIEVAEAR